jgi:hypothetical protein
MWALRVSFVVSDRTSHRLEPLLLPMSRLIPCPAGSSDEDGNMTALKLIETPDAELLALGRKLAEVERERSKLYAEEERRHAQKEAACAAVGLAWVPPPPLNDKQAWREWEARERRRTMVGGEDVNDDADNVLTDKLFALLDHILAMKANTIEGLQTQLRAFDLVMAHYVDDPHVRALFVAVCKFARVKP